MSDWNEAIEAAAKQADEFAETQWEMSEERRRAAAMQGSFAGREVDLEYAVGYAKRAAAAKDIGRIIRRLARVSSPEAPESITEQA